jgi:hypothetical protein
MMHKYRAMKEAFETQKYDWVWFLDGDAVVNNPTVDVRNMADGTGCAVFTANGAYRQNTFGFINAGSFLIKGDTRGLRLLDAILEFDGPQPGNINAQCAHWNKNDQSRVICLLADRPDLVATVDVVTPTCMNSEYPWFHDGDFVVHFPGGGVRDKLARLAEFQSPERKQEATEVCVSDQSYWKRPKPGGVEWPNAFFVG